MFEVAPSGAKLSFADQTATEHSMSDYLKPRITLLLRQLQKTLGLFRLFRHKGFTRRLGEVLAPQHRKGLLGRIALFAQCPGARIIFSELRGSVAPGAEQRGAELDSDFELAQIPHSVFRKKADHVHSSTEIRNRFSVARQANCSLSGLLPPHHRLVGIACFGIMTGEEFGLAAGQFAELLFQYCRCPGMQLLLSPPK